MLAPRTDAPTRVGPETSPTDRPGTASASAAVTWDLAVPRRTAVSRLEYVLELAGKLMQASQCGIGLLSPSGELTGFLPCGAAAATPASLESSAGFVELTRLIARRGKPVRFEDSARGFAELGLPSGLPLVGPFLGVPLTSYGRCEGVLYLTRPPGAASFRVADVEQILTLSRLLEQEYLAEEVRLLNQVRLLTQVAQAAAGNLDLTRIFEVALRELERYLPTNSSAVWLPEDDQASQLTLAQATEGPAEQTMSIGLPDGLRLTLEQTNFGTCWRDGQALYVDLRRPEGQGSELAERLAAHGATYFFAVPLRAGDQTVGVLQSICKRPTGFTGEQIQLLYRVADLLGPAISNCQLFSRLRTAYEQVRLTQKQLIQSEKMRALGELAGGMAHDFNNSLCGVVGFLELTLLEQRLPASCRRHLESARTCAQDAAQTVRRVQEFARRERDEHATQAVDPNDLVRQMAELTRPKWEDSATVRSRPITVEVRAEAQAGVIGNPAELREALTNLIFNAIDAMPQGGTLTLHTWSTTGDVFLAVRDTGLGMSESVRRRLFEPFFTTKGEEGNGLGLSVSFGIVQRHGGEISVVTIEGSGSVFTIRLPAAKQSTPPSGEASVPQQAEPRRQALRILVVEDEDSVRRFLQIGLTHLGHRPHVTASAAEGLAVFEQETFDLVLTDLGLPDVSGEELARTVAERSPGMPVVMLTGWADQLKAENKCPTGVREVLGKPITLERLAQTLNGIAEAAASGATTP